MVRKRTEFKKEYETFKITQSDIARLSAKEHGTPIEVIREIALWMKAYSEKSPEALASIIFSSTSSDSIIKRRYDGVSGIVTTIRAIKRQIENNRAPRATDPNTGKKVSSVKVSEKWRQLEIIRNRRKK